ncbi:hypothetical protein Ami103574_03275 [Aminipila butyrica]|uniref:BIG2 domain-containing protein n=1 Tax=Aminipila butyrica TaxID=433296 RepID=A0A858BWD8_9FIRM|nr:kelch repeat-containing protein [Aminipila butyrica]QIB68396.1 hypothetical protein Ami103574_03275 [Aminipila butyrica]
MKRLIAIFMTMCLVLGLSSVGVWAAEDATWQTKTPMLTARYYAASSAVGNKIYILGGTGIIGAKTGKLDSVEVYDAQTDTWTTGKSMPTARAGLTSSVVRNKIYAIGGANDSGNLAAVEIYDTQTDTWTTGKSMPTAREGAASSVVGNKIYVMGGVSIIGTNPRIIETVEIYDTETDTWTTGKSMPTARSLLTSSVVGNKIYAIGGGNNSQRLSTVEIYDTQTDTWTIGKSMPAVRYCLTSSAVGNKIYAIGGHDRLNLVDRVEIYDTQTDIWTPGKSIPTVSFYLASAVVNGTIYVMGGYGEGAILDSVYLLDVNSIGTTTLAALLNEGETVQLSTSYNLANNANYTWSSTNEAVATVDGNGKVTAVAIGEANIYAESADGIFKEFIPVKVVENADELRLAVHLKSGEKAQLYLTDDASQVIWSSMDENIATISPEGKITGVKKGLAIVQAKLDEETYQIYVRVNG